MVFCLHDKTCYPNVWLNSDPSKAPSVVHKGEAHTLYGGLLLIPTSEMFPNELVDSPQFTIALEQ